MLKKLLLSTVAGIILTGCGSVAITDDGGIDIPDLTNQKNTNTPTTPHQGGSVNTGSNTPKTQYNQEHYMTFPDDGDTRYYFDKIDTTGTEAIISPETIVPGNNKNKPGTPHGEYAIYNLPTSAYGIWISTVAPYINLKKGENSYLITSSNENTLATNLPSSGSIEYSGKAIQLGDKAFIEHNNDPTVFPTDYKTNPFYTNLDFTATVQFGTKDGTNQIYGSITPHNLDDTNRYRVIHLKPQEFTGSKFKATDNTEENAETQGINDGNNHFIHRHKGKYSFSLIGPGAKEIGGTVKFDGHPEFNTVFGGMNRNGHAKP